MRVNNSIYEFENHLKDSRMVEKIASNEPMYDLRKMASMIKILGRPLTNEEAKEFIKPRKPLKGKQLHGNKF